MKQGYLMHYGVPGMKWGVRKARQIGGMIKANTGRNYFSAQQRRRVALVKSVGGLVVKGAKAGAGVAKAGAKVVAANTGKNYFPQMRKRAAAGAKWGFKNFVFDKEKFSSALQKDKATIGKMKEGLKLFSAGLNKVVGKMADVSNRRNIASVDKSIKLFDEILKGYSANASQRTLTIAERKDILAIQKVRNKMEAELNSLFTPEELKKYRGQ